MGGVKSLLGPRDKVPPSKQFTVNVDAQTHKVISLVAKETGRSRPKVLAAFVEEAFGRYAKAKKEEEM